MQAYKGFNKDLKCRDFQFEIGKEYSEPTVELCESGFHACEHPLDVFKYYAPAHSRYCKVELGGEIHKHEEDNTKVAATRIKIVGEINIADLVDGAILCLSGGAESSNVRHAIDDYSVASATEYKSAASATGDQSVASATGDQSVASATGHQGAVNATGDQSVASATGDYGVASATGDLSVASATGNQSVASATGNQSVASATGYQGVASATGNQSAASATGDQSVASATGYQGVASATGNQSVASATGYQGVASATGYQGVSCGLGYQCKAKAALGGWIVLAERDKNNKILEIKAAIVDCDKIKADTYYVLKGGEFVEQA